MATKVKKHNPSAEQSLKAQDSKKSLPKATEGSAGKSKASAPKEDRAKTSESKPSSKVTQKLEPKIKIQGLYKSFGDKKVLVNLNLEVFGGESLVIIGGSGTGKSVLNKCILGLQLADKGSIIMDGQDLSRIPAIKRGEWMHKVGVLFQGSALFDSMPIWKNIGFSWLQPGCAYTKREIIRAAQASLEEVGLSADTAMLMPAELSGGMQRRVAFARTVFEDPELIFLDEPTTGLDPIMSQVINKLIRGYLDRSKSKRPKTVVTITHDMHSAKVIGDRVAMLHEGKVAWSGEVSELDTCTLKLVRDFVNPT